MKRTVTSKFKTGKKKPYMIKDQMNCLEQVTSNFSVKVPIVSLLSFQATQSLSQLFISAEMDHTCNILIFMRCLKQGPDIIIGYYYHQYQDTSKLSYGTSEIKRRQNHSGMQAEKATLGGETGLASSFFTAIFNSRSQQALFITY